MDFKEMLDLATIDMTDAEIREFARLLLWKFVKKLLINETSDFICIHKKNIQAIMEVAGEQVSESTSDDSDSVGDN